MSGVYDLLMLEGQSLLESIHSNIISIAMPNYIVQIDKNGGKRKGCSRPDPTFQADFTFHVDRIGADQRYRSSDIN